MFLEEMLIPKSLAVFVDLATASFKNYEVHPHHLCEFALAWMIWFHLKMLSYYDASFRVHSHLIHRVPPIPPRERLFRLQMCIPAVPCIRNMFLNSNQQKYQILKF